MIDGAKSICTCTVFEKVDGENLTIKILHKGDDERGRFVNVVCNTISRISIGTGRQYYISWDPQT